MVDEFNPPTPSQIAAQRQAAQARTAQAQQEKQRLEQQRQQAPGTLQAGSSQEAQVRQEAQNAREQALVQQNVKQVASSSDQFAAQREAALKSGSFNYGSVAYASQGKPASYLNKQGQRIQVPQGGITGSGSTPGSQGVPTIPKETLIPTSQYSKQKEVAQRAASIVSQFNKAREQPTNYNLEKPTGGGYQPQRVTVPAPVQKDLRSQLAALQGKAAEATKQPETEAVPFLALNPITKISVVPSGKVAKTRGRGATPGTGTKVQIETIYSKGTEQIPSTSVIDALQFVPVGGLGAKAASESLRSAGSIAGKSIKTGGEIIPRGIKPPEEKNLLDTIKESFSKSKPQQEKPLEPSMTQVSLGKGIGKEVSTGSKEGGLTTGTKPSGKPPTTPPKTTSAGRGLEQIVKEKPEPKTNYLGQGAKQEERLTGKTGNKGKLETIFIPKPPGTKQQQEKQTVVPEITTGGPIIGIVPPITTPKEKQEEKLGITDLLTTRVTRQTPNTERTSITDTLQTQRQAGKQSQKEEQAFITDSLSISRGGGPERTGEGGGSLTGGLGAGIPGFLEKVSKSGATREYTGNVPINDIVGVYKREEISYGRTSDKSAREKETNLLGAFSNKKGTKTRLL